MIKDMVKIANKLDRVGLSKEADLLDKLMSIIKTKLDTQDGIDIEVEEEESEDKVEMTKSKKDDKSHKDESISVHKDPDGCVFISGRTSTSEGMEDFHDKIEELQKEIEERIEDMFDGEDCDVEEESSLLSYETNLKCTKK